MSLLRPIVRACAVAALRDESWAESRVYDSDMTPLAAAVQGTEAAPYIVVYTDTDDIVPVPGVAEIYDGGESRKLNVVIEIGVASAIANDDGVVKITFSPTDFGMELAVDIISYQALAALIGNPHSKWGELFKRFILKVQRMPSRRGGSTQGGIRYAARRITLVCSTVFDISPGIVPPEEHPVWDFLNLAADYPEQGPRGDTLSDMARLIRSVLPTADMPTWRQAQSLLGLTKRGVRHLMVPGTPLPIPHIEEPPLDWSDTNEFPPAMNDITLTGGPPKST